jgi:predicted RNA-binding Zn-ribbon protein involved in translation (DUF1610 family)
MMVFARVTIKKGSVCAKHRRGIKMSARASNCTSSGVPLADSGSTSFPCPGCTEPIGRSPRCRNQGVLYTCPNCGFVGP